MISIFHYGISTVNHYRMYSFSVPVNPKHVSISLWHSSNSKYCMTQLYEMQHKGFTFFNVVVPNTNRFQSLGSYINPYVALHSPQKDYDKIFTRSKFMDNGSCLSLSLLFRRWIVMWLNWMNNHQKHDCYAVTIFNFYTALFFRKVCLTLVWFCATCKLILSFVYIQAEFDFPKSLAKISITQYLNEVFPNQSKRIVQVSPTSRCVPNTFKILPLLHFLIIIRSIINLLPINILKSYFIYI